MGIRARQRVVDVGGLRLGVLEAGAGRPVVFVHGAVTTAELFRDGVEYFASDYRALAVELRGYGASDKAGQDYDVRQFSEDLAGLFDRLNLKAAVLLGVSMGGFVAQRFAIDHPERLAGLVLASTSDGECALSMRAFDSRAELGRIRVPTLVLVGSEDHHLPVPSSRRLHQAIPGSQLVVFEGAGHFLMAGQPERFREVLTGLLISVWPREGAG